MLVFFGGEVDDVFWFVELFGVDDEYFVDGNFVVFVCFFVGGEYFGVVVFEL